ncbi:MAG: hypothetical protein EZS28_005446 [Streblomastix strix]|uniref:Uncharacterized protein n=1 Tax=Streblomastix strix TaxID=222440 RepID=A0A5J4WXR5_9EUKA|nr:MAG: hypothetical protein EZS28_005446 [Streblomastix strix]
MGIQNRTKEDIHTLEIFPSTPMEEILQPQPDTGMGGKTIRYLEMWKQAKGVEFIQKGFFLLFKNEDSEKRLQEKLRICPFLGSREEEIAYTEKLEENQRENIIEQIHPDQAKWFNPIFMIPNPHQKWGKILDANSLNKEIQTIHFEIIGTDHISNTQTIPSIRSNGESLLIQINAAWNAAIPNLPRTSASNGPNENTERVIHKDFELRGRSAPPTLEQRKIAKIILDNNGNLGSIWVDNSLGEIRNRTKTTDQLPILSLRIEKNVFKDGRPKETRTTFLTKEIYQINSETNPNQGQVPCINNRQTKLFKSPGKRSFLLLKVK